MGKKFQEHEEKRGETVQCIPHHAVSTILLIAKWIGWQGMDWCERRKGQLYLFSFGLENWMTGAELGAPEMFV